MIKKVIFFTLIVSALIIHIASAETYIKIGLKFGATAITDCTLKCEGGFYARVNGEVVLQTEESTIKILAMKNDTINITNSGGEVLYTYEKNAAALELLSNSDKNIFFNGLEYRGEYHFLLSEGKITVINTLPIEDYLRGVISAEMPASWSIEALKAQAVVARSYALSNMNKYPKSGFDVDDTIANQVYKGVSAEYPSTNKAVDETLGKVAMYDGKIAQTFFYSSSGGKTENVADVWGTAVPYLIVVDDIYEKAEEWQITFTPEEIKAKLAAKNINIGDVVDLEVVKRSGSDRIIDMLIKGTKGEHRLTREGPRSFFNIKSNLYYITKKGAESYTPKIITKDGKILDFSAGIITKNGISNSGIKSILTKNGVKTLEVGQATGFEFKGKGFGHGAGMSQYGAKGMAEQGFNYEDIIKFYYPGVYLQ